MKMSCPSPSSSWFSDVSLATPTAVRSQGRVQHFPSLIDENFTRLPPETALLLPADAVDASSSWHELEDTWAHTAMRMLRTRTLRVHIFGFSVLNGCFAHDLGYQPTPKLLCDPAWGWSRRMADALQSTLTRTPGLGGVRVHTSTFAKSAVDPSFFAHCLGDMLQPETDVVLLEAGSNMYDFAHGETGLPLAIPAIRAYVPHAAIALVGFVPPDYLRAWTTTTRRSAAVSNATSNDHVHDHPLRALMARDARALNCDIIDIPALVQQRLTNVSALMAAGCTAPGLHDIPAGGGAFLPTLGQWFAMNGTNHHPTRAGHHLIGEIAARHVLRRLIHAAAATTAHATGGSNDTTAPWTARGEAGSEHGSEWPASEHGSTSTSSQEREVCFNSADAMPVRRSGGSWQLVDEGEKSKGVAKFGWVSTRTEDPPLVIGPLPVLRAASAQSGGRNATSTSAAAAPVFPVCNTVRLGYLFATRAGQGDLRIRCAGTCSCSPVGSPHGLWQATYPFPIVKTDARFDADKHPADRNISVTAMTEFTLIHLRPPAPPAPATAVHATRVALGAIPSLTHSTNTSADHDKEVCVLEISHLQPQSTAHHSAGHAGAATRVRVDSISQRHEEAHGMMQALRTHRVQCH